MAHDDIVLRNVRVNWNDLLAPNDYGRYRVEVLIEPDSEAHKEAEAAIASACKDKWGSAERASGMRQIATANGKCCLKDGNLMPPNKKTMELADHYKDVFVLSASRKVEKGRPALYTKRLKTGKFIEVNEDTPLDPEEFVPVAGGNFADILVSFWGWEHKGSPQVNCTLEAVKFTNVGDSLGGGPKLTEERVLGAFGDLEIDEEADVLAS